MSQSSFQSLLERKSLTLAWFNTLLMTDLYYHSPIARKAISLPTESQADQAGTAERRHGECSSLTLTLPATVFRPKFRWIPIRLENLP